MIKTNQQLIELVDALEKDYGSMTNPKVLKDKRYRQIQIYSESQRDEAIHQNKPFKKKHGTSHYIYKCQFKDGSVIKAKTASELAAKINDCGYAISRSWIHKKLEWQDCQFNFGTINRIRRRKPIYTN